MLYAATLALAKKSKEGGPDVDARAYLKETARLKPADPESHAHMIPIYIVAARQHCPDSFGNSCSTRSRSRSRWFKAIRFVSIAPSATYESGHFYFAQTGHSHFAATPRLHSCLHSLTWFKVQLKITHPWRLPNPSSAAPSPIIAS